MTGNLEQRIAQHKRQEPDGFTKRYNVHRLVYFEELDNPRDAITREKQLKEWKRDGKN